ncbi:uncharacterized protein G2W53_021575 [Senna tora]|uniref:Uncharacterized protein n=1 Tax=Senna tora TaxID=362788 RepID=A0A834WL89_9FABA|nr:uncharacterized protein G2W53_021575 [Senna tora]
MGKRLAARLRKVGDNDVPLEKTCKRQSNRKWRCSGCLFHG